jgi:hypothetical protein
MRLVRVTESACCVASDTISATPPFLAAAAKRSRGMQNASHEDTTTDSANKEPGCRCIVRYEEQ